MKIRVKVPKLGLTVEEVTLVSWEKQVGEKVEAEEVIATVEADKANVEILAPAAGTLIAQTAEVDSVLPIGAEVATIEI